MRAAYEPIWERAENPARRGHRGFSLLELIVVLAIMLIILFMSRAGYLRERARSRKQACAVNLAGQYIALRTYANEHTGAFPFVTNATSPAVPLALLIPKYTTQTEFWICPGAGDGPLKPAAPFGDRRISYAYYMGWRSADPPVAVLVSDEQVNDQPKSTGQPVFSVDGRGPGNNHGADGGNYLRIDGSVSHSPNLANQEFPQPGSVILLNPDPK